MIENEHVYSALLDVGELVLDGLLDSRGSRHSACIVVPSGATVQLPASARVRHCEQEIMRSGVRIDAS